ncbi:MAG: ATP-binding protein [Gammaproteobacteria bacterium]|nr:ATP-binding protein [Gammaproteobacteria bacterium]
MQGMIIRRQLLARLRAGLRTSPAVALLGPRQCGKTTLARQLAGSSNSTYFDLENPVDLARLSEPLTALESLRGLIVIDEVQRHPDLFPILRVLLDRKPIRARFLILGSASPELLGQSSETLAGRIANVEMTGFTLEELDHPDLNRLWLRGGFPRSFLAGTEAASTAWREDFIRTFLERDLAQLGMRVPSGTMRRFWTMSAHCSGGIWNSSQIGRSLGEAHTTVRRHLDALSGALVVRVLEPWYENVGKRLVKSPKVYIRDSGLLHTLLGIGDRRQLEGHPVVGGSWEGFIIEQLLAQLPKTKAYYWRTQAGAELDLLLFLKGRRIGIEIKRADAPKMTPSMGSALEDLELHQLLVVYPGSVRYALHPKVEVMSLSQCMAELA